ncbi:MAG: potassium channel family protein [Solirubrobacteraceae bacterium]
MGDSDERRMRELGAMNSNGEGRLRPGARLTERVERRRGLRPRDAALFIVTVWLLAVVIFGVTEYLVDPTTFATPWLGMWWALETVTTVGYGDVVPESTAGRILGAFLLLGGLALLSVVTATITSSFIARVQRTTRTDADSELLSEVRELRRRVDELIERQSPR